MKYEEWLNDQLAELSGQRHFNMCTVPTKGLETLLEKNEALENYVKFLTKSNEDLSKEKDFYCTKLAELETLLNKEIENGP